MSLTERLVAAWTIFLTLVLVSITIWGIWIEHDFHKKQAESNRKMNELARQMMRNFSEKKSP